MDDKSTEFERKMKNVLRFVKEGVSRVNEQSEKQGGILFVASKYAETERGLQDEGRSRYSTLPRGPNIPLPRHTPLVRNIRVVHREVYTDRYEQLKDAHATFNK